MAGRRKALGGLFVIALLSAPALGTTTSGSFLLDWTDRVGNTHPLISTQVSVYDNSSGVATLVGTWVTDATGKMTFSTNYERADKSALQLSVVVKAAVTNVGTAGVNFGDVYTYQMPGTYTVNDGSFGTTFNAGAVGNNNDAGKAVGFMQGLRVENAYYASLGAQAPSVQVRFAPQWGNGSDTNGTSITLGYDSWGTWDAMFHEYGHAIANTNALHVEQTIGATHSFNQDNISDPKGPMLGAVAGTQFAWQEGIASYMGTSAMNRAVPGAISGMPASDTNTSYDRFSSTGNVTLDNSSQFSVDLENRTGTVGATSYVVPGQGEGDELSVARVLWDLRDNTPGEQYPRAGRSDQVSLGDQGVFNLLKAVGAGDNGRMSDLWKQARLVAGTTPLTRSLLGDVFEANGVSSVPGAAGGVADGGSTLATEPVLAWTKQNSGHSTMFEVAVYSQDWSSLLELSPEVDGATSWQLTSPLGIGTYNWVVISNSVMQNSVSFDDSYWSGGASFSIVAPEPGGMVAVGMLVCLMRRRIPRGN
ncbi:MAG TPA: hypothetical protein VFE58_17760 [Tepidisphaeraceae bacterium]|jgi:hypothetical protein|nr:hypothetical protein [Tepidisphaeraceae bacterium]